MLTSMTPGSGVTLKLVQARIGAGRRIAFDEHRLAELLGGVLDRGDEVEIVLGALGRRHEDEEMAVARLEGDRGAHDVAGRVADAGTQPEIGRQRAPPGLAAGVAVAVGVGRHAAFLAAQHRRAAEGVERRQGRMRRHRVGIGDEVGVLRRRPRQRIERQAVAERRIARDQVALLRAQEPRPAAPAAAAVVLALDGQHGADGGSRVPASNTRARRSRSISSFTLASSTVTLLGRRRSRHR